jgi:hypothetical protein
VYDRTIDWFSLQDGDYVSLPVDDQGIVKSQKFPGLWLAVNAMLSSEMQAVLATLQLGLSSAEHQAFKQQLTA